MKIKHNLTERDARIQTNWCFDDPCPIQFMLELLGSKWSVLILRELFRRDRRTHELLEALPGISSKTLTMRLRELEVHGLVKRTVFAEIPPHVEYTLTEKGREVQPVMIALKQLGEQWLGKKSCACLNQ
ncbi:HxlR family transcriptional regulator [Oscillatoriales cyanobacterium USR001]|nr:HxlR family transcriptional regulator [Oscillatoriales cyanobacterium USR001]